MSPALHATAAARRVGGRWRAVLIGGPSGAGKSDLALRLLAAGWRLVSDDYSQVWASGGALYCRAPASIAGRLEARGAGLLAAAPLPLARAVLWIDGVRDPPERLPEPAFIELCGLALPRLALNPLEASAPAKLDGLMRPGALDAWTGRAIGLRKPLSPGRSRQTPAATGYS